MVFQNLDKISLLETGGTIDKEYDFQEGSLSFKNSHLKEMISRANIDIDVNLKMVMLKDSLDFVDDDRLKILNECVDCEDKKILVSHGTDTMVNTASFLRENFDKIKGKTIVLFGAMIPYTVRDSDAFFNFGFAISSLKFLDEGVYIAINGKIFADNNVVKNKNRGVFEFFENN